MLVLGVDPGVSGALAFLQGQLVVSHWGTVAFSTAADMRDEIRRFVGEEMRLNPELWRTCVHAWIEQVHSMPQQGVASTFKFGVNVGQWEGLLIALEVPISWVTPTTWQRAMGCLSHGDKNITKRRAQELYPTLKITHQIADALLIATYGWRQWKEGKV